MTPLLRILAWALAIALTALPIVAVVNGWYATERWPLQRLVLTAEFRHVSAAQVQAAAAAHLQRGYFAVDLDAVRAAVAALPWVSTVEVRKQWPDVLEINLHEHQPVARWGRNRLVSSRGQLFAVPVEADLPRLPRLSGPDAELSRVLSTWRQVRESLQAHQLDAGALRLSARGSWRLTLNGGTEVVMGRGDPLPRLVRFAGFAPSLINAETRRLLRADLRYGNGFALRWSSNGPPDLPEPPVPPQAAAAAPNGIDT